MRASKETAVFTRVLLSFIIVSGCNKEYKVTIAKEFKAGVFKGKISNVEKLRKLYKENWEHPYEYNYHDEADPVDRNPNVKNGSVHSCPEIFNAIKGNKTPQSQMEYIEFMVYCYECMAAKIISEAKNPVITYVRSLKIDLSITEKLPPEIAFGISNTSPNPESKSWKQASEYNSERVEGEKLVFEGHTTTYVEVFAYGDFNKDGTEDILLSVKHVFGRLFDPCLIVITVTEKNGPVKMLSMYSPSKAINDAFIAVNYPD